MAASSSGHAGELSGGYRIFSGEAEDYKEYRRWKLWITNKLRTLDKLTEENYGSYIMTCLSGKALETVEHLAPDKYQKVGGDKTIFALLDNRFPELDKSDELAESLAKVFAMRAKDGESLRQWLSRATDLLDRCERQAGVAFPSEARGWMALRWSGLSEEQQAVVKGRALGVLKLDTISQAMRSVYPDFVNRRKAGVAAVEEFASTPDDDGNPLNDEVTGFDDIELFLADHLDDSDQVDGEAFQEHETAEVLATSWKERRLEISKLQKQRRFTDAKDLRRSFRVEVEELKRRTKCNRCGKVGHWARAEGGLQQVLSKWQRQLQW